MAKKYEGIVSWIVNEIEKKGLTRGDRLPSENELMNSFGVSRQTVRRALEELEKKGLVERRRGSGTYVTMERKRTENGEIRIAVMLTSVDTYIFPSIIKGIESVLSREGCTLQISVTNNSVEKERQLLNEFIRTRTINGIIAETVKSALPNPNFSLYRNLENLGIPVLFINSYYQDLDIPHVGMDDRQAGYLATKHLIECGHTRIGGIFKSDDGQGLLRYAGYTDALMENEIKVKEGRILWIDTEQFRDMEGESARFLKNLKDCTACVCYNDETAYKLVRILEKAGRKVPDQMSVVGMDNSALAKLCSVPLTSVDNPVEGLGRSAAEKMVGAVCRGETMMTTEFAPELVIRDSVQVLREFS